jgi:hypothetical protein
MEDCGDISREHTFWCGHPDCAEWKTFPSWTLTIAHRDAKRAGWRKTKEHGWLCPACVKRSEKR